MSFLSKILKMNRCMLRESIKEGQIVVRTFLQVAMDTSDTDVRSVARAITMKLALWLWLYHARYRLL